MSTAKDVAHLAKTSTAVVSYVFNNGPRPVSAATRERVLNAARQLNYRPNALARALSSGRTNSLGLIVPHIRNPYFASLAEHLERAARKRDHLLLVGDSAGDTSQEEAHSRSFIERKVDGVILVSLKSEPELAPYTDAGVPVVALQPLAADSPASSLSIDFELAAAQATAHLLGHGYRSIGVLTAPLASPGTSQHHRGVGRATQPPSGVRVSYRASEVSRFHASQVADAWLASSDRPRAIYCATDEQAFGVLFAAWRVGLSVPDDLAVMGFDGTTEGSVAIPPLASVRQPLADIARRAVGILLTLPNIPRAPIHELLPFELVPDVSCGCGWSGRMTFGPC